MLTSVSIDWLVQLTGCCWAWAHPTTTHSCLLCHGTLDTVWFTGTIVLPVGFLSPLVSVFVNTYRD